jgi:hypothetical protein
MLASAPEVAARGKRNRNRFYTKAFTPDEQASLERLLKMLNRIPVLSPPTGGMGGSGPFWTKMARTGAGVTGGGYLGGTSGAMLGGAIGVGAPIAAGLSKNLSIALQTLHAGRRVGSSGAVTTLRLPTAMARCAGRRYPVR